MKELNEIKIRRAIITGATGMLGATLTRILIEKGIEVLAVVRPNSKKLMNLPQDPLIKIVPCELLYMRELAEMDLPQCDVFYHFAWDGVFGIDRDNARMQSDNIICTLDAVEAAAALGCSAFVGAGSQAEYGRVEGKLSSDLPVSPENGYGIAKYAAGKLSALLAAKLGLRHCWVRILSLYGPMDNPYTMIMTAINELLSNKKPSFTKGEQAWDYLYSDDAAQAMYLIGLSGRAQSIYCLGSGNTKHLREYIEILRDEIDTSLPLGFGDIPYSDKQVMYLCADIDSLTRETGFVPQNNFVSGIRKTIEWVKK